MSEKSIKVKDRFICPCCGSNRTSCQHEDIVYDEWYCRDCGKEWTHFYKRKYIETLIEEEEKTNES